MGDLGEEECSTALREGLEDLGAEDVDGVVESLNENRVTLLVWNLLEDGGFPSDGFRERLRESAEEKDRWRRDRNFVMLRASEVLRREGIDHAFFKTPVRFPTWGVDADVLVPREDYWDCVSSLLKEGFFPIDDLSKTYETGLSLEGKRGILDLHTKISTLDVSYLDEEKLLDPESIESRGFEGTSINFLERGWEGVLMVGHSIIKDREIDLVDVAEVLRSLRSDPDVFFGRISSQRLSTAADWFLSLSRPLLERSSGSSRGGQVPPFKVPLHVSAMSLLSRISARSEVGESMGRALSALRFRRNRRRLLKVVGKRMLGVEIG